MEHVEYEHGPPPVFDSESDLSNRSNEDEPDAEPIDFLHKEDQDNRKATQKQEQLKQKKMKEAADLIKSQLRLHILHDEV